ncbi:MAG TPA: helix-turn-helix domain-containing protein [Gemmatirosa sp.]
MSAPYSLDLRERVLAASRADHLSPGEIAARFRVAHSTVRNWLRRARETGSVAAKPHGGGMPPKVDAAGAPVLEALVDDRNERTLAELAEGYRERTGTVLSLHAVRRACVRLDLRRKKKVAGRGRAGAARRGRRA